MPQCDCVFFPVSDEVWQTCNPLTLPPVGFDRASWSTQQVVESQRPFQIVRASVCLAQGPPTKRPGRERGSTCSEEQLQASVPRQVVLSNLQQTRQPYRGLWGLALHAQATMSRGCLDCCVMQETHPLGREVSSQSGIACVLDSCMPSTG